MCLRGSLSWGLGAVDDPYRSCCFRYALIALVLIFPFNLSGRPWIPKPAGVQTHSVSLQRFESGTSSSSASKSCGWQCFSMVDPRRLFAEYLAAGHCQLMTSPWRTAFWSREVQPATDCSCEHFRRTAMLVAAAAGRNHGSLRVRFGFVAHWWLSTPFCAAMLCQADDGL